MENVVRLQMSPFSMDIAVFLTGGSSPGKTTQENSSCEISHILIHVLAFKKTGVRRETRGRRLLYLMVVRLILSQFELVYNSLKIIGVCTARAGKFLDISRYPVGLIVLCDDEFGKKLPGETIKGFRTIKDILDFMG